MTENYIESTDQCYECQIRKDCPIKDSLMTTLKDTGLITLIVQECADYD